MNDYLFISERLGFRNWVSADIDGLYEINRNKKVMAFFPSTQSKKQTEDFIIRMKFQFQQKGYCYFAVDILDTRKFIGFIGLSEQTFKSDFTPAVDIGWRLHPKFWHKGYATEGAKRCLEFGFNYLNLNKIIAIAPAINTPSIKVMEKIGMEKFEKFKHPLLKEYQELETCIIYTITFKK